MSLRHPALWLGVFAAVSRLVLGLIVAVWSSMNPEADMLALFDLPTLGVYALIAKLGGQVEIRDAGDLRYLAAGVVIWFALAYVVAHLFLMSRPARSSS